MFKNNQKTTASNKALKYLILKMLIIQDMICVLRKRKQLQLEFKNLCKSAKCNIGITVLCKKMNLCIKTKPVMTV